MVVGAGAASPVRRCRQELWTGLLSAALVVGAAGSLITPKRCYSRNVSKRGQCWPGSTTELLTLRRRGSGVNVNCNVIQSACWARMFLKYEYTPKDMAPISGIHTTSGSGEITRDRHQSVLTLHGDLDLEHTPIIKPLAETRKMQGRCGVHMLGGIRHNVKKWMT